MFYISNHGVGLTPPISLVRNCVTINVLINKSAGSQEKSLQFKDQQSSWTYAVKSERDPTYKGADTSDTVEDFFSRPVKVADIPWTIGAGLSFSFNPWTEFFENPKVANRLVNFKNLTADLHVKFVINGNPFYYGRAIASATMLSSLDSYTTFRDGNMADVIQASQRPHIYLNPTTSEGGSIVLPYFYPKNALSIPDQEWRRMGTIDLKSINVLRHANGSTDALTVSIFVMAKNVNVSTPTSRIGSIQPQADEYGTVSGPAHTIANFANGLSKAPYIGPYARATEMIASAVGGIASLFGFSRPRVIQEMCSYRPRIMGNLASTNVGDNVQSLALDSKKEITIDPRVVGLSGEDEMAVVPLAMRESYLTSFLWDPSTSPDTHLFSLDVSPMQGVTDGSNLHVTPSAWVAMPFRYWKGSMNVRFKIVCSDYHRGRLKIVWDPDFFDPAMGGVFNTNYITIVDIAADKDFTVNVGWGQQTSYLKVGDSQMFPSFDLTGITSKNPFANGTLSVFVVNELTSPGASSEPIEINVFTSMTDDFEVACPTSQNLLAYEPVSVSPDETTYLNPTYVPPSPGNDPGPEDTPTGTDPGTIPAGDPSDPPPDPDPDPDPDPPTEETLFVLSKLAPSDQTIAFQPDVPSMVYDTSLQITRANADSATLSLPFFDYTEPATVTVSIKFNPIFGSGGTLADNANLTIITATGLALTNNTTWANVAGVTQTFDIAVGAGTTMEEITITILSSNSNRWQIAEFGYIQPTGTVWVEDGVNDFVINDVATGLPIPITNQSGVDGYNLTFGVGESYEIIPSIAIRPGSPIYIQGVSSAGLVAVGGYGQPPPTTKNLNMSGVGGNTRIVTYYDTAHTGTTFTLSSFNSTAHTCFVSNIGCFASTIVPQGAEDEGDTSPEVNAPMSSVAEIAMAPKCDVGQVNQVHFGEQVSSWRQILHRYDLAWRLTVQDSSNYIMNDQLIGFTPPGGDPPVLNTHILNWVRPAYLAYRGAMRYKAIVHGRSTQVQYAAISRLNEDEEVISFSNGVVRQFGYNGSSVEPLYITGAIDAEVPWYSNLRFHPARSVHTIYNSLNGFERTWFSLYAESNQTDELDVYSATAEDFSLHMFVGVPILSVRNVVV